MRARAPQHKSPASLAGFINEMRMVAMKLHTKEQAPKEGQAQAAPKPKTVRVLLSHRHLGHA